MKVDFIIAGYQKCGTTALHSFLSKHPKVIGSKPKEIDFFNYSENYNKGVSYYHSFFEKKCLIHPFLGYKYLEATPSYLSDYELELTVNRISNYNPNIKIIGLVRNPIDRAYSAWQMYRERFINGNKDWWVDWVAKRTGEMPFVIRRNKEEYEDFHLFVVNELNAIENNKKIECGVLEIGLYSTGINYFTKKFKNNFLVIENESLNNDTTASLQRIADFLRLSKFNWEIFEGKKIFKGVYDRKIEDKTRNLLNEFYFVSNKELYRLTSIKY